MPFMPDISIGVLMNLSLIYFYVFILNLRKISDCLNDPLIINNRILTTDLDFKIH